MSTPHYLLYSTAQPATTPDETPRWRFVLESVAGDVKVDVADSEPDMHRERLELLAVVRGLEALDQPSRVTLLTPSRYVARGIASGLIDWRENGWQWERHGEMAPIKNRDLWQRIDRAMDFHRVECRHWRFDEPHGSGERDAGSGNRGEDGGRRVSGGADRDRRSGEEAERHNAVAVEARRVFPPSPSTDHRPPSTSTARRTTRTSITRSSRRLLLRSRRAVGESLALTLSRLRQLVAPMVRPPWLD